MFGSTAVVYDLIARDNVTRTLHKISRSTSDAEGGFAKLGRAAKVAGAAVAAGAGTAAAVSVKMAADFQSSMTKIQSMAGGSAKDVRKLSDEVLRLGNYAEQSPKELADSLYHLKSVGMDNASAMKALRQSADLAAVGGNSLEETTNALAGAWRSGIKGAGNFKDTVATLNAVVGAGNMRMEDLTGAIGTGLLPSAKSFGVSLKQVGAALALMTDEGIPAEAAATRLRMSLSLLAAPSGAAEKVLAGVGISGHKLGETLRKPNGLIKTIQLLKNHLGGLNNYYPNPQKAEAFVEKWKGAVKPLLKLTADQMTASQARLVDQYGMALHNHMVLAPGRLDPAEQAAVLSRAFGGGRSSSGILTLMNNLDVLKQKQDQVNKSIGKFGDSVKTQRQTAEAQFKLLESGLEVLAIKLGNTLLPPVTGFVRFLNSKALPAVGRFGDWLGRVVPVAKIKTDLHAVAKDVSDFFDSGVLGGGKSKKPTAAAPGHMRTVAPPLPVSGAAKIGAQLRSTISGAFSGAIDPKTFGNKIGTALSNGLNNLVKYAGTLTKKFDALMAKVDWVGIGISIGKQVPAMLIGLAAGLLNFDLMGLLSGLAKHWQDVLLAVIALAFTPGKIVGKVGEVLAKIPLVGKLLEWGLNAFKKFADKVVGWAWSALKGMGKAFLEGFRTVFPGIGKSFGEWLSLLPTRVGVFALDMLQAGKNLLIRLGEGILKAQLYPFKMLGRVFGLLLKSVGDFFGVSGLRGIVAIGVAVITGLFLTFASNLLNGAARAFSWVPGLGPKLKRAAAWVDSFKGQVNASLAGIHKNVTIDVTATYSGVPKSLRNPNYKDPNAGLRPFLHTFNGPRNPNSGPQRITQFIHNGDVVAPDPRKYVEWNQQRARARNGGGVVF